jgi:hypothetical protein
MSSPDEGCSRIEGVGRLPVPRDVDAAADPDALVRLHVVQEAPQ